MSDTLQRRFRSFRLPLFTLFAFTSLINVLMLVQPIYMLQIYDRVMTSASIDTLIYISLLALAALVLLAAIDVARSLLAGRIAVRLEVELGADVFKAALEGPRASIGDVQPLRDLQAVRNFLSGRGLFAYLDLPFAPFFIALLYFIHPSFFWMTVFGTLVLASLALLNLWISEKGSKQWIAASMRASQSAQSFARSAESLGAMGMTENALLAWGREEASALNGADRMNTVNAVFAGVSRSLRIALQVAIYGYGGYLVVEGQLTAGMIFAASLIAGRSLQPIDQVIGGWKGFVETRRAWTRLREAIEGLTGRAAVTDLPDPVGRLEVENIVVFPPRAKPGAEALLKRVSVSIPQGSCVAVIGPSGAGKSTLVRALIGAVEPRSGSVRVDGSDIRHWDGVKLGRFFGYLAQDVELLPGTIAQNIARFTPNADDGSIVAAAKKAHVHALIQKLPDGYDTVVGPTGLALSGGQRQRVGLARAFFGQPRILVLDEPNANLDGEGDLALDRALQRARQDGITVLIVTQRRQIAERADRVLILRDGTVEDFGPRQEVFARQAERVRVAQLAQKAGKTFTAPPTVVEGRFPAIIDGGVREGGEPRQIAAPPATNAG